jgi:hypothetical protein
MISIEDDQQAINLIKFLHSGGPSREEEWSEILIALENYQIGTADIVMKSKELIPPEEVLRIAREKNKPIVL